MRRFSAKAQTHPELWRLKRAANALKHLLCLYAEQPTWTVQSALHVHPPRGLKFSLAEGFKIQL